MSRMGALKRKILGDPIASAHAAQERLTKVRALAVFSSDALSSVAYASEEVLLVLMFTGTAALSYALPISIAIVILLAIVVVSYRQTIYAYPTGGGSYIVSKSNLGERSGLVAAAALLTDYVLTVAVSVSAGIAAMTSAFPSLFQHREALCLFAILLITVTNLRGIRESSAIFSIPTYAFVIGIFAMEAYGGYSLFTGRATPSPPPTLHASHPLTAFVLLRAFSTGCTAMTGVEAVSNGVPVFKPPESRNASLTLAAMGSVLAVMFVGITFLAHWHGIAPMHEETVLSQLARSVFGDSWMYYYIQFTTMGILILAANTSYADFPRLASLLAKDRYLPRQLANLGDRLVFSNGIVALGVISGVLIVIFRADTHLLIPLYAVGVFLSFTLSQWGMVVHWFRERHRGWAFHAVVNGIGGTVTAIVTLIFVVTKFSQGAWIIIALIPLLILGFYRIHRHYLSVARQLSLAGVDPRFLLPQKELKQTVLMPVSAVHRGMLGALAYAKSIGHDVRAVYVEISREQTECILADWKKWGMDVPLVVLRSPYRSVMEPFLDYVNEVERSEHDDVVTIIVPEFVTAHWWEQILHNQTALMIRAALAFQRRKIVTSYRYQLD